jgi:hypothetical protein
MGSIIVHGVVNENGELIIDYPRDLPPGPVEVEIRLGDVPSITSEQILNSDFVGMWADRDDIGDSVEYARTLRRKASRRNRES